MAVKFVQRTAAPATSSKYYYANNPFYTAGYGLPNCTCYAWGRFYELTGSRPTLCLRDAEDWYGWDDGYSRGKTPRLGAVAVWGKGVVGDGSDGAGHVAVVEQINNDGSIIISESGYGSFTFRRTTLNSSYTYFTGYKFLGFIYPPVDFIAAEDWVDKSKVVSKNDYLTEAQMQINARYFYQEMNARGWTLNAIAGMLGNMETESTINPGIWESLDNGNMSGGYGLVQWTPASKYTNWCDARSLAWGSMDSAISRIIWELDNGEQYYATDAYPESFSQFKNSNKSPEYLAAAFLANYERPAVQPQPARATQARKWYDYIASFISGDGSGTGGDSGSTGTPTWKPSNNKAMPLWLIVAASKGR